MSADLEITIIPVTQDIAKAIISKPLLAGTLENENDLTYPCLATPKIDGIRALKIRGKLVSRQFKPIRNQTIRDILASLLPEGSDGEICTDGTFQDVTSKVMSMSGGIDFKDPFVYYWFDYVKGDPMRPYIDRIRDMQTYVAEHPEILRHEQAKIIPLYPTEIIDKATLNEYEKETLEQDYEGVMLRRPDGKYKMGRSSLKEGILLKMKRFQDAEAIVVGIQELFHNENEKETNVLGNSKRSTRKSGLTPANKLGALIVMNDAGEQFNIGTGFTEQMRQDFWKMGEDLIGKTVKYKFFSKGSKNAPRFPTFLGFRSEEDL